MHSGHPSAGRGTRFLFFLFILAGVFPPAAPALAQAPGGFLEKGDEAEIRPPWTRARIEAFLPPRGGFAFPSPYGTHGIRLTNGADCGGADCVSALGSASGRNINNHRGRDTMLIFLGLRGVGPTLFSYNKVTDRVVNLGPLFDASSPFASASGEGWYFSGRQPTKLYVIGEISSRLERYDVVARSFETVFDASAQFGSGTYIWQARSSDDDNVHSATLRDQSSHAMLGCLAYREDTRRFFYYPAEEDFAECRVDKSGRWLQVQEELDGRPGRDELLVDLETGAETILPGDTDGVAAADIRFRDLDSTCAAGVATTTAAHANEIVCSPADGSPDLLVVAPHMNAPGGPGRRGLRPDGSLDLTGGYFLWVSNTGGGRADAFMVKVPAQLLARTRPDAILPATAVAEPAAATAASDLTRLPTQPAGPLSLPDPTLLPIATITQIPLTALYNARNVPSLSPGSTYLDPTTGVKIYKLTSGTFPTSMSNWGHDYSEGSDEVSLPYNGNTRAVLVYSGGGHWLIDFTPGVGVSNPRGLTGSLSPASDLAFTFSSNPATPYYAYVSNGSSIIRFDLRTMAAAPGGGWPQTESGAVWLHQSENDGMFVWMRGSTMVAFEPSTSTKKTYTNANMNEPRIDRAGRYVGLSMNSPLNGLVVWDFQTSSVVWSTDGTIPFAHNASLRRRWLGVDWNQGPYPPPFGMFTPDVPNSTTHVPGPANSNLTHGNGNWIQHPADLNDQWALFTHYGSLRPPESYWLAPGGMVLMTPNGQKRLLAHPYNTTSNYTFYSFAKFSSDGQYVLFTSDMNGSGRSDLFLAEVPQGLGSDTNPPTVSLTAPTAGATVSGSAVAVSATASDNVGVVGVQFKLDGNNLGVEDLSAPYGVSWDTTLSPNGTHALTAVARDAAGNSTLSSAVSVTVNNVDTVPPVISSVSATLVSSLGATITWTTNEPADSQVEYGLTASYGSSTTLNAAMVLAHSQALSGLTAGTPYHYRVKSKDVAGNLSVSVDFTFTTLQTDAGLIAYLNFNEGTGPAAADSSGNGNAGTLMNGAPWTAGTRGTGVSFDGVSQYVLIAHAPMLDAFPLSAAVWFKTTTASGVMGLANKYVANSANGYQIFFNNGNLCAWYYKDPSNYVYDNGGCTMSTPGYNDGAWHQAALVVDGLGGRLYVDGVQKASQPWTGTPGAPTTTQDFHLGHYPGAFGGAEYLPGTIDDFRLYSRALADAEVLQLYNTSGPVADTTPPVLSAVGAASIGATGATIAWTTDEPADSQVDYGLTASYGSSTTLDTSLVLSHSRPLTGLNPTTLYHYRVKSKDAAGNLAVSSDFTFVTLDNVPPVITAVSASGITASGATIAWTTNETSDSQVEYGTTTAYGSATAVNASLVTAHSQALTGLASATLYHYRVKSKDAAGNLATSSDFTFTTVDNVAPVITAVSASGITASGATITWTTNETADSQVEYGTTTAYGSSTTINTSLVTAHSQAVTGLASATLYHYRVKSKDATGNLATSADFTLTTLDGAAPVITAVLATGITASGATITWTTNETADSQVEYGTTTAYGSATAVNASLVTAHSQALTGLASATLYHYRVKSIDAAGNLATSSDFTLTTLDNVAPVIAAVSASGITASGATITWTTNETADSQVEYGSTTAYGSSTAVNSSLVTAHSQALTGLASATLYHYRVKSKDAAGNLATSTDFTFTTLDGVAPVITAVSASAITASGATITWMTNETADSQVEYGTTTAYGSSTTLNTSLVTAHSQALTGLASATLYHYRVKSIDAAGNLATSSDFTLTTLDNVAPVIAAVSASGITASGATITWTTNETADSQVEYGTTTAYGSLTAVNFSLVTAHSQALTGLASATLYHYRVKSKDAAGNLATSTDFTFTTLDGVAPVITAVSASAITASGATITWTTNETADSQVEYGPTTAYGSSTAVNASMVTAHSQALTGLANATLYHYRVKSKDAAGNLATSSDFTFTTTDSVPPTITAVSVSGVSASGATIRWNTNETADSQVEYGPTISYGSSTTLNASLMSAHSQALTGLASATLYHYRVKSRDAAGNLATSSDFSFTTLAGADPSLIAYLKLDEGAGSIAADASGHANSGTLMNGAVWTTGVNLGGVALDGVNEYVRIAHAAALDTFPLTATVWFKTTATTGTRGLLNKYGAGSVNGYQIFLYNGALCAWYFKDGSNNIYDSSPCTLSTSGYNDGLWHHAAFVVDAQGGRLYVDRVQKASRAWTGVAGPTTTTQEIRLGDYPGGGSYLPATADEVRIYTRALTLGQISRLYRETRPANDLIFSNGFDSGDFSGWSSVSAGGDNLSVGAAAALEGTADGLQAFVNGTNALYVQDDSPNMEGRYRARFYFDTNGFDPGESASHFRTRIFIAFDSSGLRLITLVLKRQLGAYSLEALVRNNDGTRVDTGFLPIAAGPHCIEFDWQRATAPGASDGSLQLWIDEASVSTLSGIDNDLSPIDFARMGVLAVKTGATGTLFFDQFESRRQVYIGPD